MTGEQPTMINSGTNNRHMLMLNEASGLLPSSQQVLIGSALPHVDASRNIDMHPTLLHDNGSNTRDASPFQFKREQEQL